MRVGLIGAGRMGEEHLKSLALVPGVEIVGVTDRVPQRACRIAEKYQIYGTQGTVRITTDMRILAGRAGEEFVDLGPDRYLPRIGAELFSR